MGGFEIILVMIGVAWTIASSVMQKKAKAAKAARLKSIANESSPSTSKVTAAAEIPDIAVEPIPRRAKSSGLQDRLAKLREQIIESMDPDAAAATARASVTPAAAGSSIKVPRPPVTPSPDREDRISSMEQNMAQPEKVVEPERSADTLNAQELSRLLGDPSRIREAIVLSEILGPPLSLRS